MRTDRSDGMGCADGFHEALELDGWIDRAGATQHTAQSNEKRFWGRKAQWPHTNKDLFEWPCVYDLLVRQFGRTNSHLEEH